MGYTYRRPKKVGNYAYLYEITETPVKRLSPSEAAHPNIVDLLLPRLGAGTYGRVKRVGDYAYLYKVTEKVVRPLTSAEVANPSIMRLILGERTSS